MANKTSKQKPELFPINEKGVESFIPKEKYLITRSKQLSAKPANGGLGVLIDITTIKDLIKMASEDIEIAPDSDEMVKAYDLIKKDYEKAEEYRNELAAKEEEKARSKAKEEEEKKSYELKLFESVSDAEVLRSFDQVFDTSGRNRLSVRDGKTASDAHLVGALAMGFSLADMSDWIQGDAVVMLEDRGFENVVMAIADRFKVPYSTLSNKARVCRAIPAENRNNYTIPFSTIATITLAKLSDNPDENVKRQKKLLEKANKENWKQSDARQKVREAQGKDPDPASPGEKNPRYLELKLSSLGASRFLSEKPSFSENTFVVDIRSHKYLDIQTSGPEGDAEEVWLNFSDTETTSVNSEESELNL